MTAMSIKTNIYNICQRIKSKGQKMSTTQSFISTSKLQKQKPLFTLNVYLNGTACSGKTSIIHKLIHRKFQPNTVPTTNEHHEMLFQALNQTTIKLLLWDFGGCEQYKKLRISAIVSKNINKIAIIVYDACDMKSFSAVDMFISEWKRNVEKQYINSIIVVANKIDLQKAGKRQVSLQLGYNLANKHHLIYTQCSAKADVDHIFQLAYYLKLAQSQKQTLANSYIVSKEIVTDQLEKQGVDVYRFKQTSSVRELWQTKLALILYRIAKMLKRADHSNSKSEVSPLFARSLSVLKSIISEAEQLSQLKNDESMLQILKEMIAIPEKPKQEQNEQNQQEQPEYLSTNTISHDRKNQSTLQKLHDLTKNKINILHSEIRKKISKQTQQLKVQKQNISTIFVKLDELFQDENVITFMNAVDRPIQDNCDDYSQIVRSSSNLDISNNKSTFLTNTQNQSIENTQNDSIEKSESYKLLNNKSISSGHSSILPTNGDQIDNNKFDHLGLEKQTKLLMCQIKLQYQQFRELEHMVKSLASIFQQFSGIINAQYAHILEPESMVTLTRSEVYQNLVTFYIKGNLQQLNKNKQRNSKQPAKNNEKYAQNKVSILSRHMLEKYEVTYNKSMEQLQKLMKVIIVGLDRRRQVKISRQHCRILRYWVDKRKSEIIQNQANEKKGFFSRLFG